MKNDEIRRGNARLLSREAGGARQFAAILGKREDFISQLIGHKPSRNIGATVAREIEEAFEKEVGWMDTPHFPVSSNVTPAAVGQKSVPLIDYVQAGKMLEVADPHALGEGFEMLTTDADVSSAAFALEIRGNSMEPEFREGDRVIMDPALSPRPGDFVVATNGENEATFKKYRPRATGANGELIFELVPLNPDYPTLRSDVDHCRVVGTMVEHRRYRKR